MRICQNFWRPYKGFNLENVTKNNGPMSNFVMKTIGSVEMTVFQKRECWLWRLLLFLKRIHLEFLPRQMITFLARGQRFLTDSCWSTTYQWCTLGGLICASKAEKKRKDCFRSYLLLFSLSLSLFDCCIPWSSTNLQEITGDSGALSRTAEHHGRENLVIYYALYKFWFWENRPYVRTYVHPFM